VTPAQVAFTVALATVTLVITAFAVFVASSTMWARRWYPRPERDRPGEPAGAATEDRAP